MAFEVDCKDIGVANCDFTARGETPADVVEQFVPHLEEAHDLDMPSTEAIVEGRIDGATTPEPVRLTVARLREAMNMGMETPGIESPAPPPTEVPPQI